MVNTQNFKLAGDEGIISEVPNIEVKTLEFRLFLTNKRLILVENNKVATAPVEVPLEVIRSVSAGKNFADDPTIRLSMAAPDGTQKRMVLTFSQDFSGLRDKERDHLKKKIEGVVSEYQISARPAPKPSSAAFAESSGVNSSKSARMPSKSNDGGIISAENVIVKSQEYSISLTNAKLILKDPNRPNKPSDIPMGAVRSAESESNEQGEPAIVLMVEAGNGSMRRMVLSFSQWYDKNRWGEREMWVRAIQDIIATGSVGELYTPPASAAPDYSAPVQSGYECDGFSAPPPSSPPGVCGKCGAGLDPASRFCKNCGFPVASAGSPPGDLGYSSAPSGGYSGGIIDSDSPGGFGEFEERDEFPGSRGRKAKKASGKTAPRRRKPKKERPAKVRPARADNSVFGRIMAFLAAPDKAYQMTKGQDMMDAAPVFLISAGIFSFGSMLFLHLYASSLDPGTYPVITSLKDIGVMAGLAFEILLLMLVFVFVSGFLLHVGVMVAGYRSEWEDCVRIAGYSSVPFILGGIIPFIGVFLAPLWAFFLQFTGVRETYDLQTGEAAIAIGIPVILFILMFALFVITGDGGFAIFGGV
ncbi:YIP1 family protein [Methanochimaera problematica]|uniref:YIP1 family protein n=1 Tax=Methanochimaera problematica TaxID=2609417 RepID=UPI0029392FC1|nr:YIP1 family protein [Methanoplanus sp. FWC-SCC4]